MMSDMREDDIEDDIDIGGSPVLKKHKKHKKHKSKKKKEGDLCISEESETVTTPGIKLKIKIGTSSQEPSNEVMVTANEVTVTATEVTVTSNEVKVTGNKVKVAGSEAVAGTPKKIRPDGKRKDTDIFKTKKSDEDTSDEEKEWLKALESGNLDDNGLVKRDRDPMLMTARQRALVQGKPEEQLMELPSGYKTTQLTEEQMKRRQQRAKKRREQAQEKREKDKKQTVERLLKKQDSKRGLARALKSRGLRRNRGPGYRYINNSSGIYICVPHGLPVPFRSQTAAQPIAAKICGVNGCSNQKKYNCAKTGLPLCSLQCYKKNLALNVDRGS